MGINPVSAALPVLIGCMTLAACAVAPEIKTAPVAEAGDDVRVKWFHAYGSKDHVSVSGLAKRAGSSTGPTSGAVLIEVAYADGSPPAARCIPARTFIRPRQMMGGFSTSIRINPAKRIEVVRYRPRGSC